MQMYLLQRRALTINASDQHRLAIASLKHDLKIVAESRQLFHAGPARKWKHLKYWLKKMLLIPLSPFPLSRRNKETSSLSKTQMRFLRPGWFSQALRRIETLWCFSYFFFVLFKRLFTRLRLHNTSGCLSKPSEISVLIRVVFKGKIRARQILLNPPATHFTAIYNAARCVAQKRKPPPCLDGVADIHKELRLFVFFTETSGLDVFLKRVAKFRTPEIFFERWKMSCEILLTAFGLKLAPASA